MFIVNGLITGIIATFLFDAFQYSLSYAYNIDKPKWNLAGRYFLGLKEKKYIRLDLANENEISNELIFGLVGHYLIGSIFGLSYVIINIIMLSDPSLLLAIFIGFITVLGGWCIMMPFAYNIGFFACKKNKQTQLMVQNLISHFIFGIGLFLGYSIIS